MYLRKKTPLGKFNVRLRLWGDVFFFGIVDDLILCHVKY